MPPRPRLPTLDAELTLLTGDARPTPALATLTVDAVLDDADRALWVDAGGHARTDALADVAPHPRVLDRLRVARGFTPHQHAALVETAVAEASGGEVLVCPAVDAPYREVDVAGDEGRDLLLVTLARLARLARERDCPVLVTRSADDGFARPVERAAHATVVHERTRFGPRFVGPETETLTYPCPGGGLQTTLTYWTRLLRARHPEVPTVSDASDERESPGSGEAESLGTDVDAAVPREVLARGSH
jgi:hypothetical protein